jgi:CBS domain-containing protein
MFSQRIRHVMERRKLLQAAPETTVAQAAKLMAKKNVGAVMVVAEKQLVGIFTERDAVFRVLAKGRDPKATHLSEVMTASPRTVRPEESLGHALLQMHEGGFRHMPVVVEGVPVGMISARSALDPDLEEFVSEAQRRISFRQPTVPRG